MSHSVSTTRLLIAGMTTLVLAMGLARFSYTTAYPRMAEALGLGADVGGWLASVNYAGYLSGGLIASRMRCANCRWRLFRMLMIAAVVVNLLMAQTTSVMHWSLLRYLSGICSAGGMVLGSALVIQHLRQRGQPALIGVHFGGVGIGIVVVAAVLGMLGSAQSLDWRQTWQLSAALAAVCVVIIFWGLKQPGSVAVAASASDDDQYQRLAFRLLLLSYFLTGAAFAIETTFIVVAFQFYPDLNDFAELAWVLLGLAAVPSCYLWVRLSAYWGTSETLIAATLIQTLGCVLPVWIHSPAAALFGSLLFGFTFMGIVAVVLSLGGHLSRHNPARLMGLLVVAYGIGQILGPYVTGLWIEHSGDYLAAMRFAAGFSLLSLLALLPARFNHLSTHPSGD